MEAAVHKSSLETVLGPLHICYGCLAWDSRGTTKSGGVFETFASFWDPLYYTGLTFQPMI